MASRDDPPRPAGPLQQRMRLAGWKEIAAYLHTSMRTAMRNRDEHRLPVHQVHGEGVHAYVDELDKWRRERDDETRAARTVGGRKGAPAHLRTVAIGALALTVVLMILALIQKGTARREPKGWRVSGESLLVLDDTGQTLWAHAFPFPLQESNYGSPALPFEAPGLVRIVDLDGDGTSEVVFVANSVGRPAENRLYCFESTGKLRFDWAPFGTVSFGATTYGEPFTVRYLRVTQNADQSSYIWLAASHVDRFPTVIQKLNPQGVVVGEYWTNGHITTLVDAYLDGRRRLLVGGTDNESKTASLAILDYEHPAGRAPAVDEQYKCKSCPQLDPIAFIEFPQSELSQLTDVRPFARYLRTEPDGSLQVTVDHGAIPIPGAAGPLIATVHYRFDSRLGLIESVFGDAYVQAHRFLEVSTRLHHRFTPNEVERLLPVLRWTGKSFVPQHPSRSTSHALGTPRELPSSARPP